MTAQQPWPDGIGDDHSRKPSFMQCHAGLISLLLLGCFLMLALFGIFGGDRGRSQHVENEAVSLDIHTNPILRNGLFFEMRAVITPKRPIADVTLAISPALWRDMTINSMIPQASEEKSAKGAFALSYGEGKAGEPIEVKIDGQINPPLFGGTSGTVEVRDGERTLLSLPLQIKVRP